MKSELPRKVRAAWHALTDIPGWPDAPRSARFRRFLPILIPCVGMGLVVGWQVAVARPAMQGIRAAFQPVLDVESEVAALRLQLSDQHAGEIAAEADAATRRVLDSAADVPKLLAGLRESFAALGWEATFQTFEATADARTSDSHIGSLTVLGRLAPLPERNDTFQGLIKATEQVFASEKRIDLTRLVMRADEQGRQSSEMNLEIAHLLPNEKAP